jgi:hypothetical protein
MAPHHSRPQADAQRHVHHRDEVVLTGAAPGPNCALSVVAAITWRTGRAACSRPAGLRSILLGHRAKPDSTCRSDAADRPHEKAADRTTIALPYRRRYSRGEATPARNVTHMDILQRLAREPLVHFLGIGALVFALHGAGATVPASARRDRDHGGSRAGRAAHGAVRGGLAEVAFRGGTRGPHRGPCARGDLLSRSAGARVRPGRHGDQKAVAAEDGVPERGRYVGARARRGGAAGAPRGPSRALRGAGSGDVPAGCARRCRGGGGGARGARGGEPTRRASSASACCRR